MESFKWFEPRSITPVPEKKTGQPTIQLPSEWEEDPIDVDHLIAATGNMGLEEHFIRERITGNNREDLGKAVDEREQWATKHGRWMVILGGTGLVVTALIGIGVKVYHHYKHYKERPDAKAGGTNQ